VAPALVLHFQLFAKPVERRLGSLVRWPADPSDEQRVERVSTLPDAPEIARPAGGRRQRSRPLVVVSCSRNGYGPEVSDGRVHSVHRDLDGSTRRARRARRS